MPGICARCKCPVYCAEERVALGKVWHNFCFSCCECKKLLDSCTYESDGNELYCKNCLRWRSNAPDCRCDDNCGDQIPPCRSCPPPPCSVSDWCSRQSSPPCTGGYPQVRVSCSPTSSIYTQSNGACTNTVYSQQYLKNSGCCPRPCSPCPTSKPSRCRCCTKKNRNRLYSLNDNLCQKCNAGQKIQVFLNAACDPCDPKPSCRCCPGPRCDSPPRCQVRCDSPPPCRVRCDSPPRCQPRCDSPPRCQVRCNSPPRCQPRCDSPPRCQPRCNSPPRCQPRCDSPPRCQPRCNSPPRCQPRCDSPPRCQVRCGSPKPCPSPPDPCCPPPSCLLNASAHRTRCCRNKCFARSCNGCDCEERPRCRDNPCGPRTKPSGCPPKGRRCSDYPPPCPTSRCEPVVCSDSPCPPVCIMPACEPPQSCKTRCECSEPRCCNCQNV